MTCASGALCAVLLSLAAPPQATEHKVVVVESSQAATRARVIDAAAQLCSSARAQDPFGDFGSQDECIENTLNGVQRRHVSYKPDLQASRGE